MKTTPYLLLASTLFASVTAYADPFVVYVANGSKSPDDPGVYQCSINLRSGLLSCNGTSYKELTDSVTTYTYTSTGTNNSVTAFAYLASEVKGLSLCTITTPEYSSKQQPVGSFTDCSPTPTNGTPADWQPSGLAIADTPDNYPNLYAYVAELNGHVYQCTIPYNDMKLTTCVIAAAKEPWQRPNKVVTTTIGGTQYAYVAADEGVFQCSLKKDYSFGACKSAVTDKAPNWTATDVTFTTVNNVQIAYVASFQMMPGMGNPGLYRCNVASDGTLNQCASVTGYPEQDGNSREVVVFKVIANQFALIATGDKVYSCIINPDGNFSACTITPSNQTNWSPYGISIVDLGKAQTNKLQQ